MMYSTSWKTAAFTSDMHMQQEDDARFDARVQDALRNAELRSRPYFVGFLDMHQAALARAASDRSSTETRFWGGYDDAERIVLGAFPPGSRPEPAAFPVCALEISCRPSVELNHREVLGALMGLGIERDTVGDILPEPGRCVCFVRREIRGHITAQLTMVSREGVRVTETDYPVLPPPRPLRPISSTVASPRVDCVVAVLARCGRSEAADLIRRGLVMRNGMMCGSVSEQLTEGDILVIRGTGKFVIQALGPLTKKQRLALRAGQYT